MSRAAISSWGPSGWTYLHTTTFAYPESPTNTEKKNMYNFLFYFARVIPCQTCRIDFTNYIDKTLTERENSDNLNNKKKLIHFMIDAHNEVNKKLNKRIYSYEEVFALYSNNIETQIPVCIIISITLIILVVFLICRKRLSFLRF
tara:strand:+ start:234 stop:668 length:435 start_codon:yes stop_codon:yes gene_type:complete